MYSQYSGIALRKCDSRILDRQVSAGSRRVGHLVGGSPCSRGSEVPFYRKRIREFASSAKSFPAEDCRSVPILADSSGAYALLSIIIIIIIIIIINRFV